MTTTKSPSCQPTCESLTLKRVEIKAVKTELNTTVLSIDFKTACQTSAHQRGGGTSEWQSWVKESYNPTAGCYELDCASTPCLFDVTHDPTEYENLAQDPARAADLAAMTALWTYSTYAWETLHAPNGDLEEETYAATLQWSHGLHWDSRGEEAPGCIALNKTGWWHPWQ